MSSWENILQEALKKDFLESREVSGDFVGKLNQK
jgi:hypothetical protein